MNFFDNLISVDLQKVNGFNSMDDFETVDEIDYGSVDPNMRLGIPFIGTRSVPLALRANMKECWVDVFVLFGLEESGFLFNPINSDNSAMTHRVEVQDLRILKTTSDGNFVKKSKIILANS